MKNNFESQKLMETAQSVSLLKEKECQVQKKQPPLRIIACSLTLLAVLIASFGYFYKTILTSKNGNSRFLSHNLAYSPDQLLIP